MHRILALMIVIHIGTETSYVLRNNFHGIFWIPYTLWLFCQRNCNIKIYIGYLKDIKDWNDEPKLDVSTVFIPITNPSSDILHCLEEVTNTTKKTFHIYIFIIGSTMSSQWVFTFRKVQHYIELHCKRGPSGHLLHWRALHCVCPLTTRPSVTSLRILPESYLPLLKNSRR